MVSTNNVILDAINQGRFLEVMENLKVRNNNLAKAANMSYGVFLAGAFGVIAMYLFKPVENYQSFVWVFFSLALIFLGLGFYFSRLRHVVILGSVLTLPINKKGEFVGDKGGLGGQIAKISLNSPLYQNDEPVELYKLVPYFIEPFKSDNHLLKFCMDVVRFNSELETPDNVANKIE